MSQGAQGTFATICVSFSHSQRAHSRSFGPNRDIVFLSSASPICLGPVSLVIISSAEANNAWKIAGHGRSVISNNFPAETDPRRGKEAHSIAALLTALVGD